MAKKDLTDYVVGKSHIQVTLRVILITAGSIAIFAFIGYSIDKVLETSPFGFITGILVSFPMTQVIIYKKFAKFSENLKEKENENVK